MFIVYIIRVRRILLLLILVYDYYTMIKIICYSYHATILILYKNGNVYFNFYLILKILYNFKFSIFKLNFRQNQVF